MIVRCRPIFGGGLGVFRNLMRTRYNGQMGYLIKFSSNDRSKVEETLSMLKDDLKNQKEEAERRAKLIPATTEKLSLSKRVLNELKHYYHGFRLLALETRLSARYILRLARGYSLTRRERQQLIRTVSDLLRLVPFSFFIIVPFMEFTLPIFIKFFPNMLPSTFQEASKEEEKLRRQVKVRIEMANFLQDTLEEIALERKSKQEKETEESKAYEFAQFLKKIRNEGGLVSNSDLFKYTKLFEDELTLDNLAMSQLRALCRILGVPTFGPPEILRFQLNMKLRDLKADDKLIAAEGGVEALSVHEVQYACRARGMRAIGVNEERLRSQLKQWLELSLSDKVPPSLLLLSRALYIPEEINFTDRLRTILSILPDELGEQTRQKLTELEGGKIDPKARLDLLRNIEEGLKKERKESEKRKQDEELAKRLEEEKKQILEAKPSEDLSLNNSEFIKEIEEKEIEKPKECKQKVDKQVLDSLEDIIHGNPAQEAKHDITELKEKVIEHTEDLIEVGTLRTDYCESKVAKRLRARVSSMISGMDTLVAKLESERRNIKKEIIDPSTPTSNTEKERLIKIKDLLDSLAKLQNFTDQTQIEEVLVALDADTDGKVEANAVLEVLKLLQKHSDVEISAKELAKMVELLKKEDIIEALENVKTFAKYLSSKQSSSDEVIKEIPISSNSTSKPSSPISKTKL